MRVEWDAADAAGGTLIKYTLTGSIRFTTRVDYASILSDFFPYTAHFPDIFLREILLLSRINFYEPSQWSFGRFLSGNYFRCQVKWASYTTPSRSVRWALKRGQRSMGVKDNMHKHVTDRTNTYLSMQTFALGGMYLSDGWRQIYSLK